MSKEKPKVIIRKVTKKDHSAHHGGSWKVAYADFVTAMMAFFMVMWILGMDENVRQAVEGYFSNPVGMEKGYSTGASPISSGNSPGAVHTTPLKLITRSYEEQRFRALAKQIQTHIRDATGLGAIAAQVEVVVTEQGLRIELVEGKDGETFFAFGSAELKPAAARALTIIAHDLENSSTPLVVEGHTDAAPFGRPGYSNWELSADRANAARRALEAAGLGDDRIREIRGYADHRLRNPDNPLDKSNRRISILLPFSTPHTPEFTGTPKRPLPAPGST
ncbi:MAG TPA: flagellar motor protein MotB [Longimicrobiaceae bacterium]|nr:flagellar motor protein MotB [Longimicrobiaceae bacterium]